MLICQDKKWIFIRNPRTASKSTTHFLKENFICKEVGNYHSINIPKEYNNFNVFIGIRDPISRAISTWKNIVTEQEEFKNLSFNKFISLKTNIPKDGDGDNFFYQLEIINKIKIKNENLNFLFFENLQKNIKEFFETNKIFNYSSPKKHFINLKQNQKKILKKDIDYFKY